MTDINKNNKIYESIVYKNHPIIILNSLKLIKLFFVVIFFIFYDYIRDNGFKSLKSDIVNISKKILAFDISSIVNSRTFIFIIAILLMLYLLTFLYNFFIWKNSSIILENDEISSKRVGLLGKVVKQTNLSNISNITISDNIIFKLFDIVELSIDINSSETFNELDYSIVLNREKANELKHKIEKNNINIKTIDTTSNSNNIEHSTYNFIDEYKFSKIDYFVFILLNISFVNIIFTVSGYFLDNKIGYILIFIGIIDIFRNIIEYANKAYNFTLSRDKDHIKISYGLTSSRNFVIPINKVINVNTSQSMLAKILKYEYITIEAIGYGNYGEEIGLGSLYMKKKKLEEYRQKFLPEFTIEKSHYAIEIDVEKTQIEIELNNKDKYNGAKIRYIKKEKKILYYQIFVDTIIFATIGTIVYIPLKLWWIILIAIALIIISTIRSFYFDNCIILKDNIFIESGMFSNNSILLPIKNIESVNLKQDLLQKKLGIGTLTIYIKDATTGKSTETVGPYNIKHFESIIEYYRNGEKK